MMFPKPTRKPKRDMSALRAYYATIKRLPCLVPLCFTTPCHAAHIRCFPMESRPGIMTGDYMPRSHKTIHAHGVIPLCDRHHDNGPTSIHELGEDDFFEFHGIRKEMVFGLVAKRIVEYYTGDYQ